MTKHLWLGGGLSVALVLTSSPDMAATVGSWTRACVAPNWVTGVPEAVQEQNINSPAALFWGYTQKLPGGHWMTTYNLAQMDPHYATADVLKFLFYHECSHAQLATADEHLADCHALSEMQADIGVSAQDWQEISAAYASRMREFPSGGPCS